LGGQCSPSAQPPFRQDGLHRDGSELRKEGGERCGAKRNDRTGGGDGGRYSAGGVGSLGKWGLRACGSNSSMLPPNLSFHSRIPGPRVIQLGILTTRHFEIYFVLKSNCIWIAEKNPRVLVRFFYKIKLFM
jgi:hypothetical protein